MQSKYLRMFEVTLRIMPGRRDEVLTKIDTHLRQSTGQSGCAAPVHAQDYHHFLHRHLPRPNLNLFSFILKTVPVHEERPLRDECGAIAEIAASFTAAAG